MTQFDRLLPICALCILTVSPTAVGSTFENQHMAAQDLFNKTCTRTQSMLGELWGLIARQKDASPECDRGVAQAQFSKQIDRLYHESSISDVAYRIGPLDLFLSRTAETLDSITPTLPSSGQFTIMSDNVEIEDMPTLPGYLIVPGNSAQR